MNHRSLVRRVVLMAVAGLLTLPFASAASAAAPAQGHAQLRVPVNVWASDVNTHSGPHTTDPVTGQVGPGTVEAVCQAAGGSVSYGSYYNFWWAQLDDGSWISDVFISGGNNDEPVPGIPYC
ncbi:hypothetical protein [Streptomyces kanamyceticus]|uniref:SH3 domain-containing protein n=1 Tax=Streptomyces kanamyceticus TaxID=1967 RepID=A0A5J6GE12_STRKN|nr:hypothetical protein [Streptomyces kanamyceticus]QEU94170.1 hypothetical protein CP970_27615 [Streptomyces kanamyceticus]